MKIWTPKAPGCPLCTSTGQQGRRMVTWTNEGPHRALGRCEDELAGAALEPAYIESFVGHSRRFAEGETATTTVSQRAIGRAIRSTLR